MKQYRVYGLGSLVFISALFMLITYHLSPITSFAQCKSNDRNQGLISATGNVTGESFGSTEGVCITDTQDASYREFKVPSYQDLEDQFYTLSRSNAKKATDYLQGQVWKFEQGAAGDGIYLQTNNVAVNSVAGSGTQVIFIRGNLDITGNIDYADTDPASGLVFIVSGNINIAPEVTKVNAVLISSGLICTAANLSTGDCYDGQTDTAQLTINGSLISLNKNNISGSAIKFGRNLTLNNQPAERINKQPKYLYNLRRGLLTKDLIITTEDQRYLITTGTPSPSPSSTPPPGPVNCSPVPNPTGMDNQSIRGCITI